jgi:hypothetical protein
MTVTLTYYGPNDQRGAPVVIVGPRGYGGPLPSGVWIKLPAIYRLLLGGTGNVTIDTRDQAGTITTAVASYSPTGAAIEYPYFGDTAVDVRATLTGTATAEIV